MVRSPHPLAVAPLLPAQAPVGSVWHHIFHGRFPNPLGFGFTASRFSDPRRNAPNKFGVFYVGQTFEVAFLETIIRDLRGGNPGVLVLSENDLNEYDHVHVTIGQTLDLVDLRGGNALALGLPTNTVRAASHRLGQRASLAVYRRPEGFDGIWYASRLNGDDNLAIYDRAVSKLQAGPRRSLGTCSELAPILTTYRVALV